MATSGTEPAWVHRDEFIVPQGLWTKITDLGEPSVEEVEREPRVVDSGPIVLTAESNPAPADDEREEQ